MLEHSSCASMIDLCPVSALKPVSISTSICTILKWGTGGLHRVCSRALLEQELNTPVWNESYGTEALVVLPVRCFSFSLKI